MTKKLLTLVMIAAMVLGMMTAAAAADGDAIEHQLHDGCGVCQLADMINMLPEKEDITLDNATAVINQIHAIDRSKYDLLNGVYGDEAEAYDLLLTLVDSQPNSTGFDGTNEPRKYVEAVEKIRSLTGINLMITKVIEPNERSVDVSKAFVEITATNVVTGQTFTMNLQTMPHVPYSLSDDRSFYSYNENGWTYRFILPPGDYIFEETNHGGAMLNGQPYVTNSVTYSGDGAYINGQYTLLAAESASSHDVAITIDNSFKPEINLWIATYFIDENGNKNPTYINVTDASLTMTAVNADSENISVDTTYLKSPNTGTTLAAVTSEDKLTKSWNLSEPSLVLGGLTPNSTYTLTLTPPEGYVNDTPSHTIMTDDAINIIEDDTTLPSIQADAASAPYYCYYIKKIVDLPINITTPDGTQPEFLRLKFTAVDSDGNPIQLDPETYSNELKFNYSSNNNSIPLTIDGTYTVEFAEDAGYDALPRQIKFKILNGNAYEVGTEIEFTSINFTAYPKHVHTDVDGSSLTFLPIESLSEITEKGNYYLTKDVVDQDHKLEVDGCHVHLCFNGHEVGSSQISNTMLTVYNCSDTPVDLRSLLSSGKSLIVSNGSYDEVTLTDTYTFFRPSNHLTINRLIVNDLPSKSMFDNTQPNISIGSIHFAQGKYIQGNGISLKSIQNDPIYITFAEGCDPSDTNRSVKFAENISGNFQYGGSETNVAVFCIANSEGYNEYYCMKTAKVTLQVKAGDTSVPCIFNVDGSIILTPNEVNTPDDNPFYLPDGIYTMEISSGETPDGYLPLNEGDSFSFTVENGMVQEGVTDTSDSFDVIVVDNALTLMMKPIRVSFGVFDSEGQPLSGVDVFILTTNGLLMDKWNTVSEIYTLEPLPAGSYTIYIFPPDGYISPRNDIIFTVDTNGEVTITESSGAAILQEETNTILITLNQSQVSILAVDSNNDTPLEGAEIQLIKDAYNDDPATTLDTWNTEDESIVFTGSVVAGNSYTIHVNTAPDGYCIPSDIGFVMDYSGAIDGTSSTNNNLVLDEDGTILVRFNLTSVAFKLIDDDGNDITDAKLQVLDSFDNNSVVDEWTSAGSHEIVGLSTDKEYKIVIDDSTEQYFCPEDGIPFTIEPDGTVTIEHDAVTPNDGVYVITLKRAYKITAQDTKHGSFTVSERASKDETITIHYESEDSTYALYSIRVIETDSGEVYKEYLYSASISADPNRFNDILNDGSYKFVMPAQDVTIEVVFNHVCGYYNPDYPVVGDMSLNDWYAAQTAANPNAESYELDGQNYYYLDNALTITKPIVINTGSYQSFKTIDLNGKTLKFEGNGQLIISNTGYGSIRDCSDGIIVSTGKAAIVNSGVMSLFSGTITSTAAEAEAALVEITNGGSFSMFGGKIVTAGPRAIRLDDTSSMYLSGGEIHAVNGVGIEGGMSISLSAQITTAKYDLMPTYGTTVYSLYQTDSYTVGRNFSDGNEYKLAENPSGSALTEADLERFTYNGPGLAELRFEDGIIYIKRGKAIQDMDDDGEMEFDKNNDGIFEGSKTDDNEDESDDTFYIDDTNNDGTPEQVTKNPDGSYTDPGDDNKVGTEDDGISVIPDQDGDEEAERDTNKDGIFEGSMNDDDEDESNDKYYIPDGNGGFEEVTPNGDGSYTDPDGTKLIPDQDGDREPERDSDNDGIFEGSKNDDDEDESNDKYYIPDGNGGFVEVTPNGDGSYTDPSTGEIYTPGQDGMTITSGAPVISPNGGSFKSKLTVTITSSDPDAVIYYTTNGTTPSESNGKRYEGALTLTKSMTICAIAVKPGTENSAITEAKFVKNAAQLPFLPILPVIPGQQNPTVTPGSPIEPIIPDEEEHECPASEFVDVNLELWYHEAIDYVLLHDLMDGNGASKTFTPNKPLQRCALVQALYNLEGKPTVANTRIFDDVNPESWYSEAIIWAVSVGVIEGYGDGNFGPERDTTREQMVTILFRYARYKGIELSSGDYSRFVDADLVADWADDAMRWAVSCDIIGGKENSNLDPKGFAKRSEIAAVLMRYCQNILGMD